MVIGDGSGGEQVLRLFAQNLTGGWGADLLPFFHAVVRIQRADVVSALVIFSSGWLAEEVAARADFGNLA